jgi:hypothetical protein
VSGEERDVALDLVGCEEAELTDDVELFTRQAIVSRILFDVAHNESTLLGKTSVVTASIEHGDVMA